MTSPDKPHLRKLARATLAKMPDGDRRFRSALINQNLVDFIDQNYPEARKIATFASLPYEPDLSLLHALRPKVEFCYPLVTDSCNMQFHLVSDSTSLIPGKFKIPEPNPMVHPPILLDDLDLILLPGLAFDVRGFRLGHGAGYYDRLLDRIPLTPRIGISFSSQLLPHLPNEPHDHAVHTIVSDQGVRAAQ
ncbi:MAG: 5-formyltetrahydrofolate cyclo-ligase [Verrucomicrobiota bacterium JB023]|nr:5-formyltetrahydrofolate cyclo-ligase [Verrucomicrobiota bacterium JB023]